MIMHLNLCNATFLQYGFLSANIGLYCVKIVFLDVDIVLLSVGIIYCLFIMCLCIYVVAPKMVRVSSAIVQI